MFLHLISRQAALANGLRNYFTGVPCCRGHVVERRAKTKVCVTCRREANNAWNARPEQKLKRAEYDRRRWVNDNDAMRAKNLSYYSRNASSVNAQNRFYWHRNKPAMAAASKAWRERNRASVVASNAGRKKLIRQATPRWVDRRALLAVYVEAQRLTDETGVLHHVDHVVPIKGEGVCGLHVPWNLRPLPWQDNLSKKNKVIVSLGLRDGAPTAIPQG